MTSRNEQTGPADVEQPVPHAVAPAGWGSDCVAEMLRLLDTRYVALNPGASFRGLHDSLVNHLGNRDPQMLLCLHEGHAVGIAHGWAKVCAKPMAVVLHSNVGLMHGTMAIFNAWCDRVPVIILGATGPVDASLRRPWIDWIHTARDQGALVRNFVKFDDQPASVAAAAEGMLRAARIAMTPPHGPVYINLDVSLQEAKLAEPFRLPDASRFRPPPVPVPPVDALADAAALLRGAARPAILMGRTGKSETCWGQRVALAEHLGAAVFTDLKAGAAFPTDHPLHAAPPAQLFSATTNARLRDADVVLSLDWIDLGGTLRAAWNGADVTARVIQVSPDQYVHNGWSMDHQALPPSDVHLLSTTEAVMPLLLDALGADATPAPRPAAPPVTASLPRNPAPEIEIPLLAEAMQIALAGRDACVVRLPIGWGGPLWHFRHPLDNLGGDGGGGIGAGPGLVVGAALALREAGAGRIAVAVLGDGDFLMGVTAIWTAARYRLPLLIVVANNRSNFNDELHQERVALERGRPVANRWIGQAITDPDVDIAAMARAQGAVGIGPVSCPSQIDAAMAEAVAAVLDGQCVVVDVRIKPGYDAGTAAAMMKRSPKG
ncbi:thiamine pyrophosphate-binding protein [Humitalea sp. 24SJ18S-53]|uniref:thiamine pyrophosphate-binding protein n=1 Tax=Humitalea sp. 24SJ18S-53 TaxID=3422307 RepID=UPI003D66BE69